MEQELLQLLVDLLGQVLVIVVPIILARLGVWAARQWEDIKREQPEWVQQLINEAAQFGADFAEKADVGGFLEQYGRDKKQIAISAAERWLAEQGYEVDLDTLDQAIEVILFRNPDRYPSSRG